MKSIYNICNDRKIENAKRHLCLGFVLLIFIFVSGNCTAELPREKTMDRTEANELVRAFGKAYGISGVSLNEEDLAGLDGPFGSIYFEFDQQKGSLKCWALIQSFFEDKDLDPAVLKALLEEPKRGTDSGGGTVEYMPRDAKAKSPGKLFLVREYSKPIHKEAFINHIDKLGLASQLWMRHVIRRVAKEVYGK